jgi:hypothetical protein
LNQRPEYTASEESRHWDLLDGHGSSLISHKYSCTEGPLPTPPFKVKDFDSDLPLSPNKQNSTNNFVLKFLRCALVAAVFVELFHIHLPGRVFTDV